MAVLLKQSLAMEAKSADDRPARAQFCPECFEARIGVGEAKSVRGTPLFPYYCLECGHVLQQYASRKKSEIYARSNGVLKRVYTATERKVLRGDVDVSELEHMKPCAVCGAAGDTELHHWAPVHLFGDEAFAWPTSYLCKTCHVRWHQMVTPNMGKR